MISNTRVFTVVGFTVKGSQIDSLGGRREVIAQDVRDAAYDYRQDQGSFFHYAVTYADEHNSVGCVIVSDAWVMRDR